MNMSSRWLALLVTLLAAMATSAQAQTHTLDRADDGTAYQLLRSIPPLGAGSNTAKITSIGGSATGVGSCVGIGNMPGDPVSAVGGANPNAGQSLHPYNQTVRTGILIPNDVSVAMFDQHFGGRMQLGISNAQCTGAGAPQACCTGVGTGTCVPINVCKNPFDCMGQPGVVVPGALNVASGGVPAACIANGVAADCETPLIRNVLAFDLPASGNPPVCDDASAVTVDSLVCNPPPSDGFDLPEGSALLFIYNSSLGSSGFTSAFGGFLIDNDGMGGVCMAENQIVASAADNKSASVTGPTQTPTTTPTDTATPTSTNTATFTATNTATTTRTATNTPTASNTPTETVTRTATATHTETPPPTPTRPPIPVVPSPTSPAGLVMISALGVGLLWGLRRLSRRGV
jgi:hypothetical protein